MDKRRVTIKIGLILALQVAFIALKVSGLKDWSLAMTLAPLIATGIAVTTPALLEVICPDTKAKIIEEDLEEKIKKDKEKLKEITEEKKNTIRYLREQAEKEKLEELTEIDEIKDILNKEEKPLSRKERIKQLKEERAKLTAEIRHQQIETIEETLRKKYMKKG